LERIRQDAIDGNNMMPAVVEAVENYCTLGEIADVLRGVFGEHK
jgi:methylmalonyl-CoA mutase N-terminal domain/subunit